MNKKLLEDYTNLEYLLESKIEKITELKTQLTEYLTTNKELKEEKINNEKAILDLKDMKMQNMKEIEYLMKQSNELTEELKEEEKEISHLEEERLKYTNKNEEMKYENKTYSNSVKQNGATVNYYIKQLDDSNETIWRMNNIIRNLEDEISNLHNELDIESRNFREGEKIKFGNDSNYKKLQNDLESKDQEIKEYLAALDDLTEEKNKVYEHNNKMFNDIYHLQGHIYKLGNQNKKLNEKIEMLKNIEDKINIHFMRKKDMLDKIREHKNRTNKLLEKELIPQSENPDDFNTFGNLEEENKKESNELIPENNL